MCEFWQMQRGGLWYAARSVPSWPAQYPFRHGTALVHTFQTLAPYSEIARMLTESGVHEGESDLHGIERPRPCHELRGSRAFDRLSSTPMIQGCAARSFFWNPLSLGVALGFTCQLLQRAVYQELIPVSTEPVYKAIEPDVTVLRASMNVMPRKMPRLPPLCSRTRSSK